MWVGLCVRVDSPSGHKCVIVRSTVYNVFRIARFLRLFGGTSGGRMFLTYAKSRDLEGID